jgi:pimeloyl-ACP methyl ester carboxylesterase
MSHRCDVKAVHRNTPTTDKTLRAQMLAGMAVTERRLDVGGVATTVLEAGEGPALVLLHGGIECGGAYWAPVIARLAERHHVVLPDVPGLGESAPVERLDADTFAAWFGGVLAQMRVDRPTVVAHSLLGSVVARYVAQRHDAVDNLVVYAAPGVGPYRMPMGLRYAAIRFAIRPSVKNAERFDRFALLDLDATRALDPEWFAAFQEYTRRQAAIPHVKRTMGRLIGPATKPIPDETLAAITTPTTLLWGRHDRMVPLHIAQHAAAAFGWPLQIVEGAAHVPHLEQPEAFIAALSDLEKRR